MVGRPCWLLGTDEAVAEVTSTMLESSTIPSRTIAVCTVAPIAVISSRVAIGCFNLLILSLPLPML